MQLSTARLCLRSFRSEDLQTFADLQADAHVMRYLGGPASRRDSEEQLLEIIAIEAETGLVRFAIERKSSNGLIGYCGLKPAGDYVDMSYLIGREHWGQGYALEAAKRVREFGLGDLGLTNMEAGGAAENVASIKILERLSFRHREALIFNNRPAVRFYD